MKYKVKIYLPNIVHLVPSSAMENAIPEEKVNVDGLRLYRSEDKSEGRIVHPNYIITRVNNYSSETVLKALLKIAKVNSIKTLFEKDGIIIDKIPPFYNSCTQTYSEQQSVSEEDYIGLINNLNPLVSNDFITISAQTLLPLLTDILNLYLPQVKLDEKKKSTNLGEMIKGFVDQKLTTKFNISESFIHFLDYYNNSNTQHVSSLLNDIVKNGYFRHYPNYVNNFIGDIVSINTNKREGKKKFNLKKLIETVLKGSNYYKINVFKFNSLETIKFIALELLSDIKFEIESLLTYYSSCSTIKNIVIHKTLYEYVVEKNITKIVELMLTDFPNNVPIVINPNEHIFLLSLSNNKLNVKVNPNFRKFLLSFIEKYKCVEHESDCEILSVIQPYIKYNVEYLKKILIDLLEYVTNDSLITIESNLNKDLNYYSSIIGNIPMNDEFKFLEHIKKFKPIETKEIQYQRRSSNDFKKNLTTKDIFSEMIDDIEHCFVTMLSQKHNCKIIECVIETNRNITVEELSTSIPHVIRVELAPY